MKRLFALIGVSLLLATSLTVISSSAASAAACTWVDSPTDSNMSTAANWSGCGGGVPTTGDSVSFPSTTSSTTINNDIGVNPRFAGITVEKDITFTGNPLLTSADVDVATSVSFNGGLDIGNTSLQTNIDFTNSADATITISNLIANGGANIVTIRGIANSNHEVNVTGIISGSSDAFFISNAKLTSDNTNTFTAVNQIIVTSGATWICDNVSCFGNPSNFVSVAGGRVEIIDAITIPYGFGINSNGTVIAYDIAEISGFVRINGDGFVEAAADSQLEFSGGIQIDSTRNLFARAQSDTAKIVISSEISGSGDLNVDDVEAELSGVNSMSGTIVARQGGRIDVSNIDAMNADAVYVVEEQGALRITDSGTAASDLILDGVGNINGLTGYEATLTYGSLSGDLTLNGDIELLGNVLIENARSNNSQFVSLGGQITGTGNLNIFQPTGGPAGGVSLENVDPNTFDGDLVVLGGYVSISGSDPTTGDVRVETTDPATFSSLQILSSSNPGLNEVSLVDEDSSLRVLADVTLQSLVGQGGVSIGVDSQLVLNSSVDNTFNGYFYDDLGGAGARSIIKLGPGKFVTTGAHDFPFSNPVIFYISQGEAQFTNSTNNQLTLDMQGGDLSGTGSVGRINNTPSAIGTFRPGLSPGCFNVANDAGLNAVQTLEIELAGTTACSGYDQLIVGGTFNNDGLLSVKHFAGFEPALGNTFTILRAATIDGTFEGLSDGATITVGGTQYRINYNLSTSGEDTITLTAVKVSASGNLSATGLDVSRYLYLIGLVVIAGFILSSVFKPRKRLLRVKTS